MTTSEATTEATRQFLDAWILAGKPPVEKVVCPRFGRATTRVLFSHSDVEAYAAHAQRFRDAHNCVTLEWDYRSECFDDAGGYAYLFFDRDQIIKRGR